MPAEKVIESVRGKQVLVTGGKGFLGSRIVTRLVEGGATVFCLGRHSGGSDDVRVNCIRQDVAETLRRELLPRQLDCILHLASQTDHGAQTMDIFEVNVMGTARLLAYAREVDVRTFIYASTGGIYGYRATPLREEETPDPIDIYSASKYQAEVLVRNWSSWFRTIILRLFFPYGPGQKDRLVPKLVKNIVGEKPVAIYNDGRNPVINPIYVDEAVEIMYRAISHAESCILNVAGPEMISILELANRIGSLIGRKPVFEYLVDEKIDNLVADTSKLRSSLMYSPRVHISEGLQQVISAWTN